MGMFSVIQKIIDFIFQNIQIDLQQSSDFSNIFDQIVKELSKEIGDSGGNILKILKSRFNIQDPNFDEKLKEILEKLEQDNRQGERIQGELVYLFYPFVSQGQQADENLKPEDFKEGKILDVNDAVWLNSSKNFGNINNNNEVESSQAGGVVNEVEKEQIQENQKILNQKSYLDQLGRTNEQAKKVSQQIKEKVNEEIKKVNEEIKNEVQQVKEYKNVNQKNGNDTESKTNQKIDDGIEKFNHHSNDSIESEGETLDEGNLRIEQKTNNRLEKLKYQNDGNAERTDNLQEDYSRKSERNDSTQENKISSQENKVFSDEKQENKVFSDEKHRNIFSNLENVKHSENSTKEVGKVQADTQSERIQKIKEIISDFLKISINSHQRKAVVDTNLGGIRLSLEVQVDFSNKVYISITTPDESLRQELSNSYNDFKRFMQENNFFLAKFDLNSQNQDGKNNWDMLANMPNPSSIIFSPIQENKEKFSYGTIFSNVRGRINFVA